MKRICYFLGWIIAPFFMMIDAFSDGMSDRMHGFSKGFSMDDDDKEAPHDS